MSNQRWRRVEELYHAALEQLPEDRTAFLEETCGEDGELRREVESLLGHEGRADAFLEAPARARAASGVPLLIPEGALSVGAMVGPYRVEMPLGGGGMGEVYRAHDTKLGRDIVLKTLPAALAGDPAYMARFRREAQVLASLNHPNIATLHGLEESAGVRALVMELVDGETLAQRVARGALPWREALTLALQAAEGVEAAHQKGIIHRDLKPGNLMVNAAGRLKVLDFGLARWRRKEGPEESQRTSPGTLLGTVAYMAPEQAEGRDADERSDVFAFGAVLYEMLTGHSAFAGDSVAGTLSAILRDEPAPLPPDVPRQLVRVIRRCLEKAPMRRYQSLTDVKFALEDVREDQERPAPPAGRGSWGTGARRLGLGAAVAVTASVIWYLGPAGNLRKSGPLIVTPVSAGFAPAVSPDGKMIAYAWEGDEGDNRDIYVSSSGWGPPLRLTRDAAADSNPVWSPDGRQIAFSRLIDADSVGVASIHVVPVLGGLERSLGLGQVQDWSPDGAWLLVLAGGQSGPRGFFLVSTGDGSPRRLTSSRPEERPICARFSPDGATVYFVQGDKPGRTQLLRTPTAGGTAQPIPVSGLRAASGMSVMPGGKEILLTGVTEHSNIPALWRVSTAGGEARRVPFGRNITSVAVSRQSDVLVFSQVQQTTAIQRVAAWPGVDREPRPWITSEFSNSSPVLSPAQDQLAFASNRTGMPGIWLSGLDGRDVRALTNFSMGAPGGVGSPAWSPDGRQLAFDARTSNAGIYVISVAGGSPRQLTSGAGNEMIPAWSPDGKWIYFTSNESGRQAIWRIPAGGGTARQVTHEGGYSAKFSPDGTYLYYLKSSREGEIWRVPAEGGKEEPILPDYKGRNFWVLTDGIYLLDRGNADDFIQRRGRAKFFRFSSRRLEDLHFETRHPVNPFGICLSADGRWLYYAERLTDSSNLMQVEHFR